MDYLPILGLFPSVYSLKLCEVLEEERGLAYNFTI